MKLRAQRAVLEALGSRLRELVSGESFDIPAEAGIQGFRIRLRAQRAVLDELGSRIRALLSSGPEGRLRAAFSCRAGMVGSLREPTLRRDRR